jgi:hypothetical protein
MIVQYHPLTASDLNRAVTYYNRQRLGLGDDFRVEVYARSSAFVRIRFSSRLSSAISAVVLCIGSHTQYYFAL